MPIRMKALRSFGYQGVNEGHIKRGREFPVRDLIRAKDLEDNGLAYRLEPVRKADPPVQPKPEPPPNRAAEQGPFDSAGGKTGEAAPALSSPRAPAQRRRRSTNSEARLLS